MFQRLIHATYCSYGAAGVYIRAWLPLGGCILTKFSTSTPTSITYSAFARTQHLLLLLYPPLRTRHELPRDLRLADEPQQRQPIRTLLHRTIPKRGTRLIPRSRSVQLHRARATRRRRTKQRQHTQ